MTKGDPKDTRISVRLDASTAEVLDGELDRLSMSESEFVRQAIRLALGLASVFDTRRTTSDNVGDIDPARGDNH